MAQTTESAIEASEIFVQQCVQVFNGAIDRIADHLAVPENCDALKGKSKPDIATILRGAAKIPTAQRAPIMNLPPALSGAGMPAGLSNLMAIQPQAGTGTKKATRSRTAHPKDNAWIPYEDYVAKCAEGAHLCAYLATRGEKIKGLVCASPSVINAETEPNPLKWRCSSCNGKIGGIEKRSNTGAGAVKGIARAPTVPPVPMVGFNVPAAAGISMPGAPISMGIMPPAIGAIRQIPQIRSLSAMKPISVPTSAPTQILPPHITTLPKGAPVVVAPVPASVAPVPVPASVAPVPVPVPVASIAPPPVTLPDEKEQIALIQNPSLPDMSFPAAEPYRNLVIQIGLDEKGEEIAICYGRIKGAMITKESVIPADWRKKANLIEIGADDAVYLKANGIEYSYAPEDA